MPKRGYDYYDGSYFPHTERIRTEEGIKARSQHGQIGQSWWAKRWLAALEQIIDKGRLQRGRSYARSGQVLSIEEKGSTILARVQGSRPTPYKVTIELAQLSAEQWDAAVKEMAGKAIFAAQLLAGEMPAEIEEAFTAAHASLFPAASRDLRTACSCPDMANPCKHVAAAFYILGEQFDEDPFLLFRLRGRTQEQVLARLRALRAAAAPAEAPAVEAVAESGPDYLPDTDTSAAPPLEELIDSFWQGRERLDTLPLNIRPPAVPLPLLKRLGPPAFLPDVDLAALMAPVYEQITKAALELAGEEAESRPAGESG